MPKLAVPASIPARLVGVRPGVPLRCADAEESRPPCLIVSSIELFISTYVSGGAPRASWSTHAYAETEEAEEGER